MGLALAHVLNMSGMMQWAVRQTAETENDMTAVERMLEYTKLPQVSPSQLDSSFFNNGPHGLITITCIMPMGKTQTCCIMTWRRD